MIVNWASVLSAFLGSAAGAWFAMSCDGRRLRQSIAELRRAVLDLNRRVTALEVDAAAAGAQNAAAALLKKLE